MQKGFGLEEKNVGENNIRFVNARNEAIANFVICFLGVRLLRSS